IRLDFIDFRIPLLGQRWKMDYGGSRNRRRLDDGGLARVHGGKWSYRRGRGNHRKGSRGRLLFSCSRCKDTAFVIHGKSGNLLLQRAVKNERLALGRNPVDKPAAVRPRNQVALMVESQNPDVGFIAFKEDRMIAARCYAENFSMIASGHIN